MSGFGEDAVADSLGSLRAVGLVPRDDVRRIALGWLDRTVSDRRLQRVERALVAGEPLSLVVPELGTAPSRESAADGPPPAPRSSPDAATGARPNIAGVQDPAELLRLEADILHLRQVQLAVRPVEGDFDLHHLRRLHLRLLGALYWSAGDLRTTQARRVGRPDSTCDDLAERSAVVLANMERGPTLRSLTRAQIVDRLAAHLAALDALHPFAVGNACVLRAFAGAWATQAGQRVAWADLDPAESLFADAAAADGVLDPSRRLLERLVRPRRDAPPTRSPEL